MEENHEQRGKVPFWPIMIAIFFGNFVSVLSTTTINIAVPLLMNHFHTYLHTMQWMVTYFMLATGVTAPWPIILAADSVIRDFTCSLYRALHFSPCYAPYRVTR